MLRSTFILGFIGAFVVPHYLWGKSKTPKEWWAEASQEQRESIRGSYERNKAYDKGFTLAALNAIESSGGLHLLRLGEDSAGLYAQRGKYVAHRVYKTKKPTAWQISRVVQGLIQNREFDDEQARAHLDELLDRYRGDWRRVWAAWNSQKSGQSEHVRSWVLFFKYKLKWD